MWKSRKEETPFVPQPPQPAATPVPQPQAEAPKDVPQPQPAYSTVAEITRIGKSVSIRGEVAGREDLYMDGEFDGSIDVSGHLLTIGLHGRIRANLQAQSVIILGRLDGNVRASERVELRQSAVVNGDILTPRVMIEEGAFLKGSVDIRKLDRSRRLVAQPRLRYRRRPAIREARFHFQIRNWQRHHRQRRGRVPEPAFAH